MSQAQRTVKDIRKIKLRILASCHCVPSGLCKRQKITKINSAI